ALETSEEGRNRDGSGRGAVSLIDEEKLLEETAAELEIPDQYLLSQNPRLRGISAVPTPAPTPTPRATPTPEASESTSEPSVAEPTPAPIATPTPPPVAQEPAPVPVGNVVMNVLSVQRQGGAVVLNVTMQNNSNRTVRFLYSFMDVRDNTGRALSASTSGLPGELPPGSPVYSGVVRIPEIFVQGASSVSLSLPDYPSQSMWLQVGGVPLP
ncbi:MAG: hypothetical protein AAGE92_11995, partial [Cyanobacteria bacterium P01_G01_bin.4]